MRKFAIALIIILGVIIIWSPECVENTNDNKNCLERIIIEEPEIRDINYPGIKEDDTSEYIPQTIEFEEYIPQSQRLMT
jgi:hypothetical protein